MENSEKQIKSGREDDVHNNTENKKRKKLISFLTSLERKEDVFNKREDAVVVDVSRLAESLLQLLLHVFFGVQQVDLGLLRAHVGYQRKGWQETFQQSV